MKKLAITLIALGALGVGAVQAEPVRLTEAQMDTITAGHHYRNTGSLMAFMHSLSAAQFWQAHN